MLVEFTRMRSSDHEEFSNVVGITEETLTPTELKIHINPVFVAAVFDARHTGNSIIRLSDGRGFLVLGTLNEVAEKLAANGSTARPRSRRAAPVAAPAPVESGEE